MNTETLLRLAALAHAGSFTAGALMPHATGLWREVAKLSPFARGLFRTYYLFIGFCLAAFGLGTWWFAAELATGAPAARAFCGFLAGFWLLRWIAARWLIDTRPFLTSCARRIGNTALETVFVILPLAFAWAALRPVGAP